MFPFTMFLRHLTNPARPMRASCALLPGNSPMLWMNRSMLEQGRAVFVPRLTCAWSRVARVLRTAAVLPLVITAACGDASSSSDGGDATSERAPGGTLVITTPAEPTSLQPLYADRSNTRQVSDLIFERLAALGPSMNTVGDSGFRPVLADGWSWSADSLQITFALSPDARWHDGEPVRANDVAFTYRSVMDSRAGAYMRENLTRVDSVTVRDSLAVDFWFSERYPEQFFDAVEHVHVIPEHILGDLPLGELRTAPFGRAPVGSGPFMLGRWQAGQVVELVANESYHRGRPMLDRVVWTVASDGVTAASRFITGQADLHEAILPEQLPGIVRRPELRVHTGPGLAYAFLGFNFVTARGEPHPLFRERELRRALTQALDRERMVQNVFDTLALVPLGPFARALPDVDTTFARLSYDVTAATATLDSLGWRDLDGDGVRERAGRRLSFSILVPSSSPPRVRMAVLAQEQLRRIGVDVDVQTLEFNAFISRVQSGDFDGYLGAWQMDGSPSGLRQTWFANATDELGGGNFQSYGNDVFEAQTDSALNSWSRAERRHHLRNAYETIVQDAPAIWLYEPLTLVGIHGRVRTPPLRSTGWWHDVPDWWIPVDERNARDRSPLTGR